MTPEDPPVNPTVPLQHTPRNQGSRFANDTAPASARARLDKQEHDPPLPLHDPYGPRLSFSKFRRLVLDTLPIFHKRTASPPNQEAGQATTRRRARSVRGISERWSAFILTLIRRICDLFQMRLSSMYFYKVKAIIRKSEISTDDFASIRRSVTDQGILGMITVAGGVSIPKIHEINSMKQFKKNWKAFVTWCIEEWRNLNVISTVLISILLTFLQLAEAGLQPFTRLTALLSLECAFMSFLYSTVYIAVFRLLMDVEKGMNWIFAAVQKPPNPYWNMWLFLAFPAVWLGWSLVFFSASLLSFIWTSGDRRVPALMPSTDETMGFMPMSFKDFTPLWPRIILTAVFIFGLGMGHPVSKVFKELEVEGYKGERPKSKGRSSGSASTSETE